MSQSSRVNLDHMSEFNFGVQNIHPGNKRNFHVFFKQGFKYFLFIRLCFYVKGKHVKHLNTYTVYTLLVFCRIYRGLV